jgi:hypothetical protein
MNSGNDWQDLSNALESLSRPVGKVALNGQDAMLIKRDPDCAVCLAAVAQEPRGDRPKRGPAA